MYDRDQEQQQQQQQQPAPASSDAVGTADSEAPTYLRTVAPSDTRAAERATKQAEDCIVAQAVEILEAEEGGAFGAALLAGVGVGAWASVEAACAECVKVAEVVEPKDAAAMEAGYRRFRRVYPALKQIG